MFASSATHRAPASAAPSKTGAAKAAPARATENRASARLTRPAAPAAALSFRERKLRDSAPQNVLPPPPPQTGAPLRKPLPQSSARPQTSARPRTAAAQKPTQTDAFVTANIDDILNAESTKDLDKKAKQKTRPVGTVQAAGGAFARRNTTFGQSAPHNAERDTTENSQQKRASIYAGPVRVVRKNPSATAPIIPQADSTFSHQTTTFAALRRSNTDESLSSLSQHYSQSNSQQHTKSVVPADSSIQSTSELSSTIIPHPQTPSSMKPPQRVAVAHIENPTSRVLPSQTSKQPSHQDDNIVHHFSAKLSLSAEALTSTSIYRGIHSLSSNAGVAGSTASPAATSNGGVQLIQTPRRILEQTKTRTLGLAVMDAGIISGTTPSRLGPAARAGNLMNRFQQASCDSMKSVTDDRDSTANAVVPVPKPETIQDAAPSREMSLPQRGLLPNPFEVLGMLQPPAGSDGTVAVSPKQSSAELVENVGAPFESRMSHAGLPDVFEFMASCEQVVEGRETCSSSTPMVKGVCEEVNEAAEEDFGVLMPVTESEVVKVVHPEEEAHNDASSTTGKNDSDTTINDLMSWKRVSPRREGGNSGEKEYRGGHTVRADPVSLNLVNQHQHAAKEKKTSETDEAVALGDLEERFRGIASRLLGQTAAENKLPVAAEPLTESTFLMERESETSPPFELKWESRSLANPAPDLDHDQINCELDVLDEEERKLILEIRKMGISFDVDL
ncbi:hypothetical protein BDR26DRAFT_1003661 [Obelidium mucronatum]|nr:hypothetical protein BDR26DRAFT_1003661 [Obelidium mucronatum]